LGGGDEGEKERYEEPVQQPPFPLSLYPAPYLLIPLSGKCKLIYKNRIIPHWWFDGKEVVYVYKNNITDPIFLKAVKGGKKVNWKRWGEKKLFLFAA
jgi:hypothetical protein